MLFDNRSKPELIVRVPEEEEPKAVVVLFGWFASKLRHVRKYSEIYEQRGCATITCSVDSRSQIFHDLLKIDELCHLVSREAAKLLRANDNVPLVCHAFSNGGGVPLQRMEQLMDEKMLVDIDDERGSEHDIDDWRLLRDRLECGAEIFDSAPAFIDMEAFRGTVEGLWTNLVVRYVVFLVVAFYFQTIFLIAHLQGKKAWTDTYWSRWESCRRYTPVQAYIYSTIDNITKSSKLDELVKKRADQGVNMIVKRFDDSLHVQHLTSHREEYCGLIEDVLNGAAARLQ